MSQHTEQRSHIDDRHAGNIYAAQLNKTGKPWNLKDSWGSSMQPAHTILAPVQE